MKTLILIIAGIAVIAAGLASLAFFGGPARDNSEVAYQDDRIRVAFPLPHALVQSPLTVRGSARGVWYFEASFPVRLYDGNGRELAVAPATAQGEWMTTEFVPFEGTLAYEAPMTETGTLVFQKDNPSGLPEHDASISVPIRFRR